MFLHFARRETIMRVVFYSVFCVAQGFRTRGTNISSSLAAWKANKLNSSSRAVTHIRVGFSSSRMVNGEEESGNCTSSSSKTASDHTMLLKAENDANVQKHQAEVQPPNMLVSQ